MFSYLQEDLSRYYNLLQSETLRSKLLTVCSSYGFHAIVIYRFGRWAKQTGPLKYLFIPIYVVFEALVRALYDISISDDVDIGKGFYIGHFGGVQIEAGRIGSNCSLNHQTKITEDSSGAPLIEDRVWIGAHVTIVGPIRVQEGASIAVGSTVAEDVPAGSLVSGVPARVLNTSYDNRQILGLE